jgi:hypothetical protein
MKRPVRSLASLQRWMQAVITHPDGVEAGADSPAARQALDVPTERVEEVVDPSQSLSGLDRLGIYGNAYYARLIECLRAEYSALCKLLGEETFDALAFGYLQQYPSRSYTLNQLGDAFPQYLAELREEAAGEDEADAWPLLMIELATFERSVREVFDGPGAEDLALLSAADLATVGPAAWLQTRLAPVPCLRLARFSFPVHAFFLAAKGEAEPEPPEPRDSWVALSRVDYVVQQYDLAPAAYAVLEAILADATVEQAIAAAVAVSDDVEALTSQLGEWFRQWTVQGFFRSLAAAE